MRVPGVARAKLDDERVAAVLNWMLEVYGGDAVAPGFAPYAAAEVGAARREPLANAGADPCPADPGAARARPDRPRRRCRSAPCRSRCGGRSRRPADGGAIVRIRRPGALAPGCPHLDDSHHAGIAMLSDVAVEHASSREIAKRYQELDPLAGGEVDRVAPAGSVAATPSRRQTWNGQVCRWKT